MFVLKEGPTIHILWKHAVFTPFALEIVIRGCEYYLIWKLSRDSRRKTNWRWREDVKSRTVSMLCRPPLLFQHGCSACALKYRTDWRLTRSLPYRASLFLVYIKFVWMQIPFCTSLLLLVLFSGITFTNYSFQWALLSSKQLTASQKLFPVQWFELVYLVCLFMNNVWKLRRAGGGFKWK